MRCAECKKEYEEGYFYADKNGCRMNICKNCATKDLNVYQPFKTPDLFEYLNIPIILSEWYKLLEKYYQPLGIDATPISIFGRYLSKMKLRGYKFFTFNDSARLNKGEL